MKNSWVNLVAEICLYSGSQYFNYQDVFSSFEYRSFFSVSLAILFASHLLIFPIDFVLQ